MSEKLLTSDEVAEWLQIPVRTLDEWSYHKKGPAYYKIGRHRRYRASDVQAWIDHQKVTP